MENIVAQIVYHSVHSHHIQFLKRKEKSPFNFFCKTRNNQDDEENGIEENLDDTIYLAFQADSSNCKVSGSGEMLDQKNYNEKWKDGWWTSIDAKFVLDGTIQSLVKNLKL